MRNKTVEELFEQEPQGDLFLDDKQAQYDYNGSIPEDEDIADWHKITVIGAIKVG